MGHGHLFDLKGVKNAHHIMKSSGIQRRSFMAYSPKTKIGPAWQVDVLTNKKYMEVLQQLLRTSF